MPSVGGREFCCVLLFVKNEGGGRVWGVWGCGVIGGVHEVGWGV